MAAEESESIERQLALITQVFVFKIPPRTTAAAHLAADWPKDPSWEGRIRITACADKCWVHLVGNDGTAFVCLKRHDCI